METIERNTAPLSFPLAPGFIVGASLAGLFDGIVLHQILQWHHMLCIETHCVVKTVEVMKRQNFYDGIFHLAMYILLLIGLALFTGALRNRTFASHRFWGAIVFGFGVFNVLEGIIDHHILQIHHVRFGPNQPAWDISFLILGVVLAGIGFSISKRKHAA